MAYCVHSSADGPSPHRRKYVARYVSLPPAGPSAPRLPTTADGRLRSSEARSDRTWMSVGRSQQALHGMLKPWKWLRHVAAAGRAAGRLVAAGPTAPGRGGRRVEQPIRAVADVTAGLLLLAWRSRAPCRRQRSAAEPRAPEGTQAFNMPRAATPHHAPMKRQRAGHPEALRTEAADRITAQASGGRWSGNLRRRGNRAGAERPPFRLAMRMLASGHRRGHPDGGSPAVTVARRAWGAPSGVQWDQPQRESRAPEEDRVVGANPPITSILPDEGWAPLLEIIVKDAPLGRSSRSTRWACRRWRSACWWRSVGRT